MIDDTHYTIPEHYQALAAELKPIRDKVQTAVRNRTTTSGKQLEDLKQLPDLNPFGNDMVRLSKLFDSITREVLTAETPVQGMAAMNSQMNAFHSVVNSMLRLFQSVSSCQFPNGYEEGHRLMVAILEKPLLQLVEFLGTVLLVIENPDAAVKKYGTTSITLNHQPEIQEEIGRFNDWCSRVQYANSSTETPVPDKKKGGWFWPVLGAFGLYSLFHHDCDH